MKAVSPSKSRAVVAVSLRKNILARWCRSQPCCRRHSKPDRIVRPLIAAPTDSMHGGASVNEHDNMNHAHGSNLSSTSIEGIRP